MAEAVVARNKVVTLTYTIVDDQKEIVEKVDIPVNYVHGRNSGLLPKIEQALEGKKPGDEVILELEPKDAFGEWDPEKSFTDAIENVPPQFRKIGAEAKFQNAEGEELTMTVTHVDNASVTLDGNHPFAGKTITFYVVIKEIRDPSPDEMRSGVVAQHKDLPLH